MKEYVFKVYSDGKGFGMTLPVVDFDVGETLSEQVAALTAILTAEFLKSMMDDITESPKQFISGAIDDLHALKKAAARKIN